MLALLDKIVMDYKIMKVFLFIFAQPVRIKESIYTYIYQMVKYIL